jgi:RNase H-fold protein (predicted Holliday junction resolvase)
LSGRGMEVVFVDERYTTPRGDRNGKNRQESAEAKDKDSAAACEILRSFRRS